MTLEDTFVTIFIMARSIVMDLSMMFLFALAYNYWRKRKSPASIFLVLGLALHMPFSIEAMIASISVILYKTGVIPSVIGPYYGQIFDRMATAGQILIIPGFWMGIRKSHKMIIKKGLQHR